MSDGSVRTILHIVLYFHPDKMQIVQLLNLGDSQQKIRFCEDTLRRLVENDEKSTTCGWTIKRTSTYCVLWIYKSLYIYQMETFVYFMKHIFTLINLTVLCAISANRIIGLLFFQNDRKNVVTFNSKRYVATIRYILSPKLTHFPANKDTFFRETG